jgi:hypothetical protein
MATPRRPSKPKPSTIARRGKVDPLSKKPWAQISERVKTKINNAARSAALEIMNGLAAKSPAYSGDFRDSWRANALGGFAKNQPSPKGYPYRIQDVPQLKMTVKALQRVTVFEIVNTSPYALYAMDILEGRWIKPKTPEKPVGGIEFKPVYGIREKGPTFRWDVNPDPQGTNVSTAERDWYENYARGGEMSADVKRVVRLAFRKGDSGVVVN